MNCLRADDSNNRRRPRLGLGIYQLGGILSYIIRQKTTSFANDFVYEKMRAWKPLPRTRSTFWLSNLLHGRHNLVQFNA